MEATELANLLDVLQSHGVVRAKVPVLAGVRADGPVIDALEVEFAPAIEAGPVQASEDELPWNARDPDEAIARANFPKKP